MNIKSELVNAKSEINDLKEQSFAYDILKDYKKTNKRLFVIWIITFIALIGVTCYTVYLLNDTVTSTDTIEIEDVESIDNSHIKIGDDLWEKLD